MFLTELLSETFNSIRKVALGFDECGLKFKTEHLELMFPKVLSLPLDEQAEYSDFVTVVNVNKDWLIEQVISITFSEYNVKTINTTSIGNMAYIAINCKDGKARESALNNLRKATEYFKN
jgi:hypothetical protein